MYVCINIVNESEFDGFILISGDRIVLSVAGDELHPVTLLSFCFRVVLLPMKLQLLPSSGDCKRPRYSCAYHYTPLVNHTSV